MGPNSRFKIIVQTTVGEMKDQGIRIASRCLWDPTTDNYASCSFKNVRIYCFLLLLICIIKLFSNKIYIYIVIYRKLYFAVH